MKIVSVSLTVSDGRRLISISVDVLVKFYNLHYLLFSVLCDSSK